MSPTTDPLGPTDTSGYVVLVWTIDPTPTVIGPFRTGRLGGRDNAAAWATKYQSKNPTHTASVRIVRPSMPY